MIAHADQAQDKKSQSVSNAVSQMQSVGESTFQFVDNRPEAIAQMKLKELAENSPRVSQLRAFQNIANNSPQFSQVAQLQAMADNHSAQQQQPIQKKKNNTGLPDNLKSGMENLSGMSLDDVNVHRNSDKPAQLQAHAYAQGTDIHLGPGQEKHLPHEAWHVVQQKQGRVQPTMQMKGMVNVNDDAGLEKEADVMGAKAMQMKANSVLPTSIIAVGHSSTVQRETDDEKQLEKSAKEAFQEKQRHHLHLLNIQSVKSTLILQEIMASVASATNGEVYKSSSRKKIEDSKTEDPKIDNPKTDDLKTDVPKTDVPKTEDPKTGDDEKNETNRFNRYQSNGEIKKAAQDIKKSTPALAKSDKDYKGDTSRLIDMTRGTIKYETFDDLVNGFKQVEARVKIISGKDKFDKTKAQLGYSDVNLTIQLSTGHIAELQLHLESIAKAKNESGHEVYENYRKREGELRQKEELKGLSDKKFAAAIYNDEVISKLRKESEEIYAQAKKDGNINSDTTLLQTLLDQISDDKEKSQDKKDEDTTKYKDMFNDKRKGESELAEKVENEDGETEIHLHQPGLRKIKEEEEISK